MEYMNKYANDAYETGFDAGYKKGKEESQKDINVLNQTIERLKDVIASSYQYDLDDEQED